MCSPRPWDGSAAAIEATSAPIVAGRSATPCHRSRSDPREASGNVTGFSTFALTPVGKRWSREVDPSGQTASCVAICCRFAQTKRSRDGYKGCAWLIPQIKAKVPPPSEGASCQRHPRQC